MTKFTTIESWLKANPSQEEVTKVLFLINRGETNKLRKECWEKEQYLRKLYRSRTYLEKVNIPMPKQMVEEIEKTRKSIEALKKLIPAPVLKPKKFIGDDVTE